MLLHFARLTRTSIRDLAPILTDKILVPDTCNDSTPIFLTSIVQVFVYALTRRRIGAIGQRKHWSLIAEKMPVFDLRGRPTSSTIAGSNRDRSEGICLHVHGKKINGFLAIDVGFECIGLYSFVSSGSTFRKRTLISPTGPTSG